MNRFKTYGPILLFIALVMTVLLMLAFGGSLIISIADSLGTSPAVLWVDIIAIFALVLALVFSDNQGSRDGIYFIVWCLASPIVRLCFRLKSGGQERIPSGPIIFAADHRSHIDPVMVCASLPVTRPVAFMAKSEMFGHSRFIDWFLRRLHVFPVKRDSADREAIAHATGILANDGAIGIFPEGTRIRGEKVSSPNEGAAFISIRSDVPIVPVGIVGTDRIHPVGAKHSRLVPVAVMFGEPIYPADFSGSRRERTVAITAALMDGIAKAMAEAEELL